MNSPIVKAIDKQSVHQICSGQVVVTLATAVKELVENSLDAGATTIEVRLKNCGADSLEVIDNGLGVLPENFAALALKHHTSKLNVFADLVGVETFGFRGEALSSLCALGNLSITTCHKSQNIGARIEYNHDGLITKQQATARTQGTTVTLQNLFSTLPVRHKEFLRNIKREYTKMMQVLQGYCVISSGIRISCCNIGEKGKKSLALVTHGNNEMKENISNVFGPKQLQTLVEFSQINPTMEDCEELGLELSQLESDGVFRLTGFVSRCDHGTGRSASDRQYVFINKRPCDMPKVTRLVNEVYHVFNRNQYPFLVLNIDLSKDLVDLNVTPDKRQVFLQQEKLLLATIKSSLKAIYDSDGTNYETNQKPFTQSKLSFTNLKKEEATEFSKSIKDRILLAAKVSKNKETSSILKFTQKASDLVQNQSNSTLDDSKTGNLEGPVDDSEKKDKTVVSKEELNSIGEVTKLDRAHPDATLGLDNLPSKDELNDISAADEIGRTIDSRSKDESTMANVSGVAAQAKCNGLLTDSIKEVHEKTLSPRIQITSPSGNGHAPLNPNEYDLRSIEENRAGEERSDLSSEERTNYSNSCTPINNKLPHQSTRILGQKQEVCPNKDDKRSLTDDEMELSNPNEEIESLGEQESVRNNVVTTLDSCQSETQDCKSKNLNRMNLYGESSANQRELKRRRTDEGSDVERKKVKLDDEYRESERSSRKIVSVNFDIQELRENFAAASGSGRREERAGCSRTFRAVIAPEGNQKAEEELERHVTKKMFGKMDILGQFNQGFIITKLKDDLFIIDQHAADEKYNFEDQQRNSVLKSQRLICPQSLDLTAVNENILMENLEVFRKNGFDFVIDETAPVSQRVKLVSSPVSRNRSFGKSDIDELIFMLSDSPGVNYRPSNVRKMFASRACRMSVMVGTALNDGQMKRIVGHMGEMDHPWNCPHGRPTMRHLINLHMVRK